MISLRGGPGGYLYCRRLWRKKAQEARAIAEIMIKDDTGKLEDMRNCSAMNILGVMRQIVRTN